MFLNGHANFKVYTLLQTEHGCNGERGMTSNIQITTCKYMETPLISVVPQP
jgi:hypothetical protein